MNDQVITIMENVFECTLEMINKGFSDFPEHRVQFYTLLRAINLYCFPALMRLDNRQFKIVVDACLWAIKHDNRDVESAGLNMLIELVAHMAETDQQTRDNFFQQYFTMILQDTFFVLCDPDHKAGFKYQTMLLVKLFNLVESGKLGAPIYSPDRAQPGTSNKDYLRGFTETLLANAFSNLNQAQIKEFVESLMTYNTDLQTFKVKVRDFLISKSEFSSADKTELFAEDREREAKEAQEQQKQRAMKVGGLMKPSEIDDDEL